MNILAIDPGVNGGYALSIGGDIHLYKWEDGYPSVKPEIAITERVHASPQMGVVSAFTFGQNYGKWLGWLEAMAIPTHFISPQKWQYGLKVTGLGDERKRNLKAIAEKLYPNHKITLKTCDAILILDYYVKRLSDKTC